MFDPLFILSGATVELVADGRFIFNLNAGKDGVYCTYVEAGFAAVLVEDCGTILVLNWNTDCF